jgi:hypothetical protein
MEVSHFGELDCRWCSVNRLGQEVFKRLRFRWPALIAVTAIRTVTCEPLTHRFKNGPGTWPKSFGERRLMMHRCRRLVRLQSADWSCRWFVVCLAPRQVRWSHLTFAHQRLTDSEASSTAIWPVFQAGSLMAEVPQRILLIWNLRSRWYAYSGCCCSEISQPVGQNSYGLSFQQCDDVELCCVRCGRRFYLSS